jgi:hypothetical protein
MYSPKPSKPPFDPRRPFSRAEARSAGLTPEMLQTKRFHKLFWDSYVLREVKITPLLRAQAVLNLVPAGSHISHHTAAELWDATVPSGGNTHVWTPSAQGRQMRQGVKTHYGNGPAQTTLRSGIPISTPEQTFLDLAAAGLQLVDLVVTADGIIQASHTTPERLIVLAGLPEPKVNLIIRARDGSWRRRYDLAYEQLRLIIEYDGRQHASDTKQWLTDIFRREELDKMHWRLIVVTAEGIYTDPLQTLVRVRDALIEQGAPNIRRTFKPQWRVHFPTS